MQTSQEEWERCLRGILMDSGKPLGSRPLDLAQVIGFTGLEKGLWRRSLFRQAAANAVLNNHIGLGTQLEALTRHEDIPTIGIVGMAHYRSLTWADCREHHARTLAEMRRVRLERANPGKAEATLREANAARERRSRDTQWLTGGPSLLARFPTAASVEELATVLESEPDYAEYSADALSVCVTGSSVPRVRAALLTAEETLMWREKATGLPPEHDFARLKAKLANPSANLMDMPEVMGVRFVIPDPEAAAVNDLPTPAAFPNSGGSVGWLWWLTLALIPFTAWKAFARRPKAPA